MSDIFGFSTISERFPVEEVGALASLYLDTCFEEVHARGGEITKFIGDSVLAYFPETAAEEAIDCAMAILQRFREIRRSSPRGSAPAILHAGFGMSAGQVLEGTVGSTGKLDYTVLGDAVNTAARIESMTRQLGYNILVTKDIAGGASPERKFVSLGHHTLKGKSIRVHLLSVDSPLAKELPLRSLA
jgi:class 3 adenylate cyclase